MIRRKLAQFMIGRYGARGFDKLGTALFIVGFSACFIGLFFRGTVSYILFGVQGACYLCLIFRLLSRNVYARQKENAAFCGFWEKIKGFFKLQKNRVKDRGEFVYKKCPKCSAVLRLPATPGEHTVKCPRCGERFGVSNK